MLVTQLEHVLKGNTETGRQPVGIHVIKSCQGWREAIEDVAVTAARPTIIGRLNSDMIFPGMEDLR